VAYIRVGLQSDVWAYNWGWRVINAAAVYGIWADKTQDNGHISVSLKGIGTLMTAGRLILNVIARENSRHFATSPLVSTRNDV